MSLTSIKKLPSLASLTPQLLLGLNTQVHGNIHFLTDNIVVYPVGSTICLHDFHEKKQVFIKLQDFARQLTSICVSPNKELIAVVEEADATSKLPVITLWDAIAFRKRKVLHLPNDLDIDTTRFVTLDFTFDSKTVIAVTGHTDWGIYQFRVDRTKLESRGSAVNPNSLATVNKISCNPNDVTILAIIGESQLRILMCAEGTWRQFSSVKCDNINMTCCCWISQDRLLAGSSAGKIFLVENGDLKMVFDAATTNLMELVTKDNFDEKSLKSAKLDEEPPDAEYVYNLLVFSKGFFFSFRSGKIFYFEKLGKNTYRKRTIFHLPTDNFINSLCINPGNDLILVTCDKNQIYCSKIDYSESEEFTEETCEEFGLSLHDGPIGGMDVAKWKPWVLTSGKMDCFLKLYDYEAEEMILQQKFEDDLHGISLHPTGLYILAGFTDKIRFMMVMVKEFKTFCEFPIRQCKMLKFSTLGHLFAAANGPDIQVFSCITFELMYVLKGHHQKITGLSWSFDDRSLASCGEDGAAYHWDVVQSQRLSEVILKTCHFIGCAMAPKSNSSYTVSNSGRLRQINNSLIARDVTLEHSNLLKETYCICLSNLETMMFLGGSSGNVYSLRLPIIEKADFQTFNMQNCQITNVCFSHDEKLVFSSGQDGSFCIWKVHADEELFFQPIKNDTTKEIFIARQFVEEQSRKVHNLEMRIEEKQAEFEYQTRQQAQETSLKIQEVHEDYGKAIEELKEKNETMDLEYTQEAQNLKMEISELNQSHDLFVQKLEASYNEKLIFEYEKYGKFEKKVFLMKEEFKKDFGCLQQAKLDGELLLKNNFSREIREKELLIKELQEKIERNVKEHEVIKEQIEDDADGEIVNLKLENSVKLKQEQDLNVQLRGEASVVQKKLLAADKEMEKMKFLINSLKGEHVKFKNVILNLEKEVLELRNEIKERDGTIEDKEKRIHVLKNHNQELEKIKYLLDYKIKELKMQIEPKDQTIQQQNQQINEMVLELEHLQKVIQELNLLISNLKEKLVAEKNEVEKEREKRIFMKHQVKIMKNDIHRASGFIQNIAMLKKSVREMYQKYNADKEFIVGQAEDLEAKNEFLRQRTFLENNIGRLQQKVVENSSTLTFDKRKLLQENAVLLEEINRLRMDLQEVRKKETLRK